MSSVCSVLCLYFAEHVFFCLTRIADMLPGFKEGQEKMSKSDPSSAIFMEDDEVYISHRILFFPVAILLLLLVLVTLNTHK